MFDDVHISGQKFRDGLQALITARGYGLLQAVKRSILSWQEDRAFPWAFDVARYPLPHLGEDRTVDLILRHRHEPALAVVTICRADRSQTLWCLGRDPHLRSGRSGQPFILDQIRYEVPNVSVLTRDMLRDAFQVATITGPVVRPGAYPLTLELGGPSLDAALHRTGLSANRLMDFLGAHRKLLGLRTRLSILPVLVTNAPLAVCQTDLGTCNLQDARVQIDSGDLEMRPWVYHQYIQPPDIKHQVRRTIYPDTLDETLDIDHLRTVAITQAADLRGLLEEICAYLPESPG